MKKTLLLLLACFVSCLLWADEPFRKHRYDLFKVIPPAEGSIVFVGNSITDMHPWVETFRGDMDLLPIVNRGNSGTYSTEQSANLESYLINKPKKLFMMIGTNDIATNGLNFEPKQVLAYVKSMVQRIHRRSPETQVYLYSILNNNTSNREAARWLETNRLVKAFVDETNQEWLSYIDLYDLLSGVAEGGVWSYDKLHLTAASYQKWTEAIRQYLDGNWGTTQPVYPSNAFDLQQNGGLNGSHGMRATYFSLLPIKSDDILFFGDEEVKAGEWNELCGNQNIKNRGSGWSYGGLSLENTKKMVEATFADTHVDKIEPKAVLVYAGTSDVTGNDDLETVKLNYTRVVEAIMAEAPSAHIYVIGLHPTNNATTNTTRIAPFNEYLSTLGPDQVSYIDCYNPLLGSDNVAREDFLVTGTNYLSSVGYVKMAYQIMTSINTHFPEEVFHPISEDMANQRVTEANIRNHIGQALTAGQVVTVGNGIGEYSETGMQAFNAKAEEAYELLDQSYVDETKANELVSAMSTAVNEALNQPVASTEESSVWYQIRALRAPTYYVSATGAEAGIAGLTTSGEMATSMWKFVKRTDGSYDIVNREYGTYIKPVANYNTQLQTTATQPEKGWTLSYANTPGLYIVSSGTVQFNQTQSAQNYAIYNWSNGQTGTDRADTGCQFMLNEAPEPIVLPDEVSYTIDKPHGNLYNSNGKANQSYNKEWRSNEEPALTFTSNANNMEWVGDNVDLMTGTVQGGATYTLTAPTGYVIKDYAFKMANNNHTTELTMVLNGTTYTSTQEVQLISAQKYNQATLAFTLSGTNGKGLLLTDFTVTVCKEDLVEADVNLDRVVDKDHGDMYNSNGSANQNYNKEWRSNEEPVLTFTSNANNMTWNGTVPVLMSGSSGSATYTLSAPAGYWIASYSFEIVNSGHTDKLTLSTSEGKVYTTSDTEQTHAVTICNESSVTFTLQGTNGKGVMLKNFQVKLKEAVYEKPIVSTEGNEHWYYITNASTKAYCQGKVMYYDAEADRLRFGDKAFSADRVWSFWEQDGKLTIKNYNGVYMGTAGAGTGGSTQFGKADAANYIYTIEDAYGYFIIKDNATELHAQEAGAVIVRWSADAGNASLWKFDAVDTSEPQAKVAAVSVKQGKVTTGIGNKNQPIVLARFNVTGLTGAVNVQGIKGKVVASQLADVKAVKAYYTTNSRELFVDADNLMPWREQNGVLFGEAAQVDAEGNFAITGSLNIEPGTQDLWIAYDIADDATEGHTVDAIVTGYTINGNEVDEANGNPDYAVTIFLSEGAALMPYDCGSRYYRIPAITTVRKTKDDGSVVDRLVVLTDDRLQHNGDLPNQVYIVAQYSDDQGRSWTQPVRVAGTAELGGAYGHGDASIVTDRRNGHIIGIMTCAGTYGHGFWASTAAEPQLWKTITSTDGGETWSRPVDHTKSLYGVGSPNPTWKGGFSGSGAALQKRDGTLVSSFVNREDDNSQNFYFFMSDDGGASWHVTGTSGTTKADEPKTLERNNGDLSIFVRANGYNYHNVTSDNGQTWHYPAETRFTSGINGTACDGEYMVWCSTLDGNPWNIAFETLPNASSRRNVSICLSTDEGETFGEPRTICPWASGYSTAVVLPDGTLGVYYEEDGYYNANNYVLRFVRMSLDWASGGQYKFTAEQPFHPIAGGQVATGVNHVNLQQQADAPTYDLSGRRVLRTQRGHIYLRGGQKFIAR